MGGIFLVVRFCIGFYIGIGVLIFRFLKSRKRGNFEVKKGQKPVRFERPRRPPSSSEEMLQRNNEIPQDVVDTVSFRIKWEFRKERYRFGDCHRIWKREKELYREYGYEWYSPQEVYPNAKFD